MSCDTWRAEISLEFKQSGGQTVLTRCRHQGPLLVQKPFYPEPACHVYLLHPPGGIAGCDELKVAVAAHEGTRVLITTPGAAKFYKSCGSLSRSRQDFEVGRNASVEYLPAQNIYYRGARVRTRTVFRLGAGARFAFREVAKCGMADEPEPFRDSSLLSSLSVFQEGTELLNEVTRVEGQEDLEALAGCAGCAYIGFYVTNGADGSLLNEARALLAGVPDCRAAAGLIGDLLCVRFLSRGNEAPERAIVALWALCRGRTIGLPALMPRIWST